MTTTPHDPAGRETARDWLVTGQEARFEAWLAGYPLAARQADPWLLLHEGLWHRHARRIPEARHCLEAAAAGFEASGDAAGAFAAAVDLLGLATDRQDPAAVARWSAAAALRVDAGDPVDRAELWHNLACAEAAAGRPAAAEEQWLRVLDLPRFGSVLLGSIQQFAAINLGVLALERADLDEAARRFRKALALAERTSLRPAVPYGARLYLARIAHLRGDPAASLAALAALGPAPDPYRAAEAALFAGEAHLALGDLDRAEAAYDEALAGFDAIEARTPDVGLVLAGRVRVRARQGRAAEAAGPAAEALALAGAWPQYQAAALLARAEAEADPAATLADALARAEAAGSRYHAAWAGLALGGARADAARGAIAATGAHGAAREWGGRPAPPHPSAGAASAPAASQATTPAAGAAPAANQTSTAASTPAQVPGAVPALAATQDPAAVPAPAPAATQVPAPAAGPGAPPRAPRLHLDLLGEIAIRRDGEPLDRWPRRKARLLLIALALHPAGYAKEDLADLLSPDLAPAEAEHQLDNQASVLRKLLEPDLRGKAASAFLEVRDRRYRLRPGVASTDVQAFEAAVRAGALARALELYRGDLAAEPALLEHFGAEREHLRQQALGAALALAERHAAAGHLEEAQATWERALAIEPAGDEANEALIALFERHGRPSLAEHQRRRWDEALAKLEGG